MASFRRKHFHKRPQHDGDDDNEEDRGKTATNATKGATSEHVPEDVAPSLETPAARKDQTTTKKKKTKKKKRHTNNVAPEKPEIGQQASDALRNSLRKRLKTRVRMMTVARSGGTSQDVQNVLNKFNDGDDEKAELMREIQDDVKGMKQKDAKRYLKQVLGSMNKDQADSFVDMVKDKVPSTQSSNIVNYVKRHKKIQERADSKKPQVNPDTVYVPTRLMTDEAKAQELAKRQQQSDQAPTKKRKAFGHVNIRIPKLSDLRNYPATDGTTPGPNPAMSAVPAPKSRATSVRKRMQDIEALFPTDIDARSAEEREAARLTYFQRIRNVQQFDAAKLENDMRQFMFEASNVVEVLRVREVEILSVPEALEVPGTLETVGIDQVPIEMREQLSASNVAFRANHEWVYKRVAISDDRHELQRIRNAYPECARFLQRFDPVKAWLQTLVGKKIPWKWFCDLMNDVGVLRQKPTSSVSEAVANSGGDEQWPEYFRVLCHEYRTDSKNLTVPIVPFVRLTMSCAK